MKKTQNLILKMWNLLITLLSVVLIGYGHIIIFLIGSYFVFFGIYMFNIILFNILIGMYLIFISIYIKKN